MQGKADSTLTSSESVRARERELLEASERRLARLGFDLHDGPLQDLVVLGQDLSLLADQLALVGGIEDRERGLLRGRMEDLHGQLEALEASLRLISTSAHASVLGSRPMEDAVGDLASMFATRCGVCPYVRLDGDFASISSSQRIALLSVVGEALNNIREHSDASEVAVTIAVEPTGVKAQVLDNGKGFDVEAMLLSAGRRGRIGLAGIYERIRLLDGSCDIDSRPGGPTTVSVTLPRWKPQQGHRAPGVAA